MDVFKMIKILASLFIIVTVIFGVVFNFVNRKNVPQSNYDWLLIEYKEETGWSYWQDRKNPEICTLYRSTEVFFLITMTSHESMSYVPCDKIQK